MKEYSFKSKVYITPNKKSFLPVIVVNTCVVLLAIITLISILMDGVKLSNLSTLIVSIIIAVGFKKMYVTKPYYQFSIAKLSVKYPHIVIQYDCGYKVNIDISTIYKFEYSDKLECLRFVCNYIVSDSNKTTTIQNGEYLLYISDIDNHAVLEYIEEIVGYKRCFVDR